MNIITMLSLNNIEIDLNLQLFNDRMSQTKHNILTFKFVNTKTISINI